MGNTLDLNEELHVSRHLNSLKRLWKVPQCRYGSDDPLVLELQREIEVIESRNNNCSVPCRDFIREQADNRLEHSAGGRFGGASRAWHTPILNRA